MSQMSVDMLDKSSRACLKGISEISPSRYVCVTHQEQEQHRHQQKQQVVPEAGLVLIRPGPLENLTMASTTCNNTGSQ